MSLCCMICCFKYFSGLKVDYEIPGVANSKRTYKVNSLKPPAVNLRYYQFQLLVNFIYKTVTILMRCMEFCRYFSFTHEDRKMTVAEYYEKVKGYRLRYPQLPCLHLGSLQRTMYMPIEVRWLWLT